MSDEELLRQLGPQALAVVARKYGDFSRAEDAVQEALLAATTRWPASGRPGRPLAWLIGVASRRMADDYRRDEARRRREVLAASWSQASPVVPGRDDTLLLLYLCCHPCLTPAVAIPLALRAVGGLTTRQIAGSFLVPEATMAQRISRAKAKLRAAEAPFALPSPAEQAERLRSVLHVLYVMFNEGYVTSSGPELVRADLSAEAIRLARLVHQGLPEDPEVSGLLALLLLTDARRPARTGAGGELVPLAEQDRGLWDRDSIAEGLAVLDQAVAQGRVGEYQLQAAINAVHARAAGHDGTDWSEIAALYGLLEQMTGNPMVTLNRAVAVAMASGPPAGLALLDGLEDRLGDHHRLRSVRGHLLELAGDTVAAIGELRAAAARTTNAREQQYLMARAAGLTPYEKPGT